MSQPTNDSGTIQVLLERLEKWRLPRALAIKQRVDAGEVLNELDIEFMKDVVHDAIDAEGLVITHPEYCALAARLTNLYDEITRKALQNEEATRAERPVVDAAGRH